MKSIDKLRKILKDCTKEAGIEPDKFDTYWITAKACDMLIDEIEAEIAERFIALPADEEGDVLRIGDVLKCQGESIILNSLSWDGRRWFATETIVSSGWYPVHLCHHVKPRTLEDVLNEFGIAAARELNADPDGYGISDKTIAKCVSEIRELLGGDAE